MKLDFNGAIARNTLNHSGLSVSRRKSGSPGRRFAVQSAMNLLCPSYVRRKAVWGPKRIVWPTLLIMLGFAQLASADGRHVRHAPVKKAGASCSSVTNYRLD